MSKFKEYLEQINKKTGEDYSIILKKEIDKFKDSLQILSTKINKNKNGDIYILYLFPKKLGLNKNEIKLEIHVDYEDMTIGVVENTDYFGDFWLIEDLRLNKNNIEKVINRISKYPKTFTASILR